MGWQAALTGSVRIGAKRARELFDLRVDWHEPGERLGDYLGRLAVHDRETSSLRFKVGWRPWHLRALMNLLAALKDLPSTDVLDHAAPTHDAWYNSGRFFVERGRWGYVGAGPMFDQKAGTTRPGPFDGPADPRVEHVRTWERATPVARRVALAGDGLLEIDTFNEDTFRVALPPNAVGTPRVVDGATKLEWSTPHGPLVTRLADLLAQRV